MQGNLKSHQMEVIKELPGTRRVGMQSRKTVDHRISCVFHQRWGTELAWLRPPKYFRSI